MHFRSVQTSKNGVIKSVALKIIYSCKMKKNKFGIIYLNVTCYKQHVNYFKETFPNTVPPTYKEWAIKI